ncbi:MAG TPA: UpxY family transcription antiterminator [Candidatus Acidoferrum sp.]|nr:UpxY family transcription antiterminator [Candidatus Acidoferrum sp.]
MPATSSTHAMSSATQFPPQAGTLTADVAVTHSAAGGPSRRWYAIWTRSRHEKKVTSLLHERGWEAFLPLTPEVHWWSDRRKIVDVPLFPGYTFLHAALTPQIRAAIACSPGVVSMIGWNGVPLPIPERQIESVRTLLARRICLRPYQFLPAGTRVRIRGGSLEGIEGVFVGGGSERNLVVSVELIQRSVVMRLDGYDVVRL